MFGWFKNKKKTQEKKAVDSPNATANSSNSYEIKPVFPFGYKSFWLAVSAESATDVAEAIKNLGFSNFLVNESMDGWVFVHNLFDSLADFSIIHEISDQAANTETFWDLLQERDCTDEKNLTTLTKLSE